jgi:nitrate reductase gamma subunit
MPDALRAGVIISALFALAALTVQVVKTLSFGKRPFYSRASGSRAAGVVYVFGKGMMPWEKESARKHPLTYLAGVAYHAGIFAALYCLLCSVFSLALPRPLLLALGAALTAGGASGLGLLLKRVFSRNLRRLSCPDDHAANAIVTLFVILAAVRAWQLSGWESSGAAPSAAAGAPGAAADWLFYAVAILMFLYVPVGKIRHCFFFFYSRVLLGIFFGRRAALPEKRAR